MLFSSINHFRNILFTTGRRALVTSSSSIMNEHVAVAQDVSHQVDVNAAVSKLLGYYNQARQAFYEKKGRDARLICQTALPLVDNLPDEIIKANPTLVDAAAMMLFVRARHWCMDAFTEEGDQQVRRDYDRLIKVAPDTLERNRLRALLVTEFKMTVEEAYPDLPVSSTDEPRVQLDETKSVKPHQTATGAETSSWSNNNVTLLGGSPKPRVTLAEDETPSRDLSFRASAIS